MKREFPIATGVELIQDVSSLSSPVDGFLKRLRHRVKTRLSDGTRTDVFVVDFIDRDPSTRDAAGIIVFARGARWEDAQILLRQQMRYAAYLAIGAPLTTEIFAGVMEASETAEQTAIREILEEGGIVADPKRVRALGRPVFMVPGAFTERMHLVAIEVDASALDHALAEPPRGDGSPFEEGAQSIVLTLREALDAAAGRRSAATPEIADAKTELALLRLKAELEGNPR